MEKEGEQRMPAGKNEKERHPEKQGSSSIISVAFFIFVSAFFQMAHWQKINSSQLLKIIIALWEQ